MSRTDRIEIQGHKLPRSKGGIYTMCTVYKLRAVAPRAIAPDAWPRLDTDCPRRTVVRSLDRSQT